MLENLASSLPLISHCRSISHLLFGFFHSFAWDSSLHPRRGRQMDRRQLRSPKLPAGCLSAFLAKPIEQMFLFVVELQGNAVEKNYLGTSSTLDGYSLQSKSLEAMEAKLFFLLFI